MRSRPGRGLFLIWRDDLNLSASEESDVLTRLKDRLHNFRRGRRRPDAEIILRKEVIQPQVPLRLPCYDLVPIAEFIFGA